MNDFKPGHCPSCKHPQHIGVTCVHEMTVPMRELGEPVAVLCGCPPEKAIKADGGKQQDYDLFAWDALDEIVQIYQYGIQKGYLKDSWRQVPPQKYRDALVRHMKDLLQHGPSHLDHESGRRTLAHFAWNAITYLVLTR